MTVSGLTEAVERASALAQAGDRAVLGIAGAPGAGKSTLASALAEAVDAVVVPMDGFHLAQAELDRLGRAERKGALDTFDGHGFVSLLRRLRTADAPVTYAPVFRREIEEPVAGAIAVRQDAPLVIVEGNYLLVDESPWDEVRGLLDACWFVEIDETTRLERLVARHEAHGRSPQQARVFAHGSDQVNAELIAGTRPRADWVIRLTD